MKKEVWGRLKTGEEVHKYLLKNDTMEVEVTDFGATMVSIRVPDANKEMVDVLLGYDTISEYEKGTYYFGAAVGRVANRVEDGHCVIDGKDIYLEKNDGGRHQLHSGSHGFSYRMWEESSLAEMKEYFAGEDLENSEKICDEVVLKYIDEGGDGFYPGTVTFYLHYALTLQNQLLVQVYGKTTENTCVNVTMHPYFNLEKDPEQGIYEHYLQIEADEYMPLKDGDSVPRGDMVHVMDTPFDYTVPIQICEGIHQRDSQLVAGNGYDHNFILRGSGYRRIATVYSKKSRIHMDVSANTPGVQLYTANWVDHEPGKNGRFYEKRDALCLEPQYAPNAMNMEGFMKPLLKVGETYHLKIGYGFYVE